MRQTYAVHGSDDKLIPCSRVAADEVVPGGGHVVNLTHADAVNAFLRRVLDTAEGVAREPHESA